MPWKTHDEVTLRVDRLSYGGRGVGRVDGFVIFVADTAPGDVVRARLTNVKRSYAEAELVELTTPGPDRVTPRCPHFGVCGGCLWQHIDYQAQARAKQAIIEESLAHLGGLRDLPIAPMMIVDEPWYYRNKMEFSFHPPDALGLHQRGRWDAIINLDVCFLQSPLAVDVLREVREFVRGRGISCYDPRTHDGFLRHLVLRHGASTGEVLVGIITASGDFPDGAVLAQALVAAHPEITGIVWATNVSRGNAVQVSSLQVLYGRPHIFERLRGLTFKIGLLTFFQPNSAQAERMIDVIRDFAALSGRENVLDLYCGIGTFALALAERARHVMGIELEPVAVDAARENARLNHLEHVEFHAAPAGHLSAVLRGQTPPDLVVLDPPRAGAGVHVMRHLGQLAPARVLYVSCNPTTLAPDLRELVSHGYTITAVQPLDLFPHTYHVECIVRLERQGRGAVDAPNSDQESGTGRRFA